MTGQPVAGRPAHETGPMTLAAGELLALARRWASDDPDPATTAELLALVERGHGGEGAALTDLRDRFAGTLEFGTAGLRGALGAGPNRMNRAVVIRAAAGLVAHLLADRPAPAGGGEHPAGAPPSLVIGYDARRGSADFARDTAAVAVAAGVRAALLPRPLPTPVLAFAARSGGFDAGVMVTASHNPAADNGYKVYLGGEEGGSQIVPPTDAAIAARIDAVGGAASVPRATSGWEVLGDDVLETYLSLAADAAAITGAGPDDDRRARLKVVLTPLHGVGGAVVTEALRRCGVTDVTAVPEQAEPDPAFPTVAFPNPEEPGALDLALALARERGADLVIAVDPDADRCAVAVPAGGGGQDGDGAGSDRVGAGWRVLTGDELGAVLGDVVARAVARTTRDGVLACSVVSSRVLLRIAAAHGLEAVQTLTGFKWISRVPGLVYGYEEAIGYCVAPALVRDKDGISAAVLVAAVAADLAESGRTLLDALDDLDRAHGVHATAQLSVRVADPRLIDDAMARLRAAAPVDLAGSAVVEARDLRDGGEGLPPTDALLYRTADDARVVVRPSGTEPKLKAYLEVVVPVGSAPDGLAAARVLASDRLEALRVDVSATLGLWRRAEAQGGSAR